MSTEAPEAPVTEAPAPAAPPAAPPAESPAPRIPAGEPGAGQFAPQQQAPPAAADPPRPAPPPEPDYKAELAAAHVETERIKAEADRWKQQSRAQEQRSKANHAELKNRDALLRDIAAKLDIDFDDKPDPAELSARLEQAQAAAKSKTVELAVYTSAAQSGANAGALLDSREFMSRTAALDPDAADFPSQVADLVAEASRQARYQNAAPPAPEPLAPAQVQAPAQPAWPPASSSGADFSGAPGGNRLWTQADLDAYNATSGVEDRDGAKLSKAISDGLLRGLGIGQPKARNRR